jgi:predicted acylesterase/phospholipase RssA
VGWVEKALEAVAEAVTLSQAEKHAFFKRVSTSYGRTALCLSGGARLAYYHFGTIKALFDNGLLPTVITGTSGGSLIAAMVCVRSDAELAREVFVPSATNNFTPLPGMCGCLGIVGARTSRFAYSRMLTIHIRSNNTTGSMWDRLSRLWRTGTAFEADDFYKLTQWYTKGTTTFAEAYQCTGRILCISVVSAEPRSPPKLLNYLTAPDVVISTAVLASSAIPGILPPVELLQKARDGTLHPYLGSGTRWRDGSLKVDIPERELHRLFNVNYSIVSQVNPHITAFFYYPRGCAGEPSAHHRGRGWRGGYLSSWLVQHYLLDLQKWLSLIRDMDMLPHIHGVDYSNIWLQQFQGNVTICPSALGPWRHVWGLMDIPTDPGDLEEMMHTGGVLTFAKVGMIASRMRVERVLTRYRLAFAA